ncbi:hypothetical protein D3C83_59870 [compost metagenome]
MLVIGLGGVGLSVVQECVQAHGGNVVLRPNSALGGAQFVVRLPLLRRAEDRPKLVVANG